VTDPSLVWHRALAPDELLEGRVKPATCGHRTVCMTHFQGEFGALDNRCPHQGGPLGEGAIEKGLLRCPWHGWDYHPLTGKAPGFKEQRAGNWDVWQTSLHNADFARYAELCGARGFEVIEADQLDEALGSALAHEGPALVEIRSDAELV
jgi:nitrite reductase/ring-hydroxylating ferredoxin subunit